MKKGIFTSLVVASFLVGCGGGGGSSGTKTNTNTNTNVNSNMVIADIFPRLPKVPLDGSLKLTAVVMNDYTKTIIGSSLNTPVVINWRSLNKEIAEVSNDGVIYALKEGSTKIEASIDGSSVGLKNPIKHTIDVKVVNTVGNIAEISLSPTRATIDLNKAKRTFDLTAIDTSGVLTSLSQGKIEFNISNPQNTATKIIKTIPTVSKGENKVDIETLGDRIGYVFITPTYIDRDNAELMTTGTPLVVQVSDIPKANPDDKDPTKNLNAGKFLDLKVNEVDGRKELHVVHYDEKSKRLKYSYFNGTWKSENIKPSQTDANISGIGAKIVLSPFENNYKKPIIVALEDSNITLWYKNDLNNWVDKPVSTNPPIEPILNYVYNSDDKFLDSIVDEDSKLIYVAYFSPVQNRIYLTYSSMDNSKELDFSKNILPINVGNHVQSLSLTLNEQKQPRIAFATIKDTTQSSDKNGVFYGSINFNTNKFSIEKVDGTTGDEKGVVLKLHKTNRPSLIYHTPSNNLVYRERNEEHPNQLYAKQFVWTSSVVSYNEPITKITSADLEIDYYNSPRIVFNSDDKIRYARRVYLKNNEWIVETPEVSSGKFGEYKAVEIDSENRVHIVYTSDTDKWFKYWAEPMFFDYRKYELNNYIPSIDVVN